MQIISVSFLIYTISGIWHPIEWSSNVAKMLYNVFTFIVLILIYFSTFTIFMHMILVVNNIAVFIIDSLLFVNVFVACFKATIVLIRRNKIINIIQMLLKEPCKPRDNDEVMIQTKFDKFIRSWSIKYSLLVMSSIVGVILKGIFFITLGRLPYNTWLPCDTNAFPIFWIISVQQLISVLFAATINIGTETLIFGLFLQTCAQFEIFESRLRNSITNKTTKCLECSSASSNNKRLTISEYIYHHLSIYKYAETVNITFNQIFFVQFFFSIFILCANIYYLTLRPIMAPENVTLIVYIISSFIQIYVYCWSGNEVILKSENMGAAVYHMDWFLLSEKEKKDLLIIMIRSTIPIKFTSGFLITYSLESYTNILKTSYSVFNLLQSKS